MATVVRSHQVFVKALQHTAFDYVSDLTRHPEWSGGELRVEALTPGPIAVGKIYLSHGEVAIQKARPNTVRISHYEPPSKFGFIAKDPNFGEVSHMFAFHAQTDGVLIQRIMTLRMNPLIALVFRLFIYPLIGHPSMEKALDLLKVKLEAQQEVMGRQ